MLKRNKNNKDTNSMYKENSTEYIKTEKNTNSYNAKKKNTDLTDYNIENFEEVASENTSFQSADIDENTNHTKNANLNSNDNLDSDFSKEDIYNDYSSDTTTNDIDTMNTDSTSSTSNANEKIYTKKSPSKKNKFIIIYIIIIILLAISFFSAKSKLNNNPNSNNSYNTSNSTNTTPDNQPINQKIPISTFNASNTNLDNVQNAQSSQLNTFTDKFYSPFIASDFELDPMSLNLLNSIYIQNGYNSGNNPLTTELAQKVLSNTTIPFTITNSTHSDTMQNQNIGIMLTLDNNLHVTNVINDPSKGVALVSFDFATKFENEGGLITIKGIALLNYMNGTWIYSRMIEQKSVRTYPYLTPNDLKSMFNTAMINRYYNLIPSSIKISNIQVVDPYIITADISGKGVSTFANGQINKSNINETWQVTFIKDRTSIVSTTIAKLIVAQWHVYKAQTINQ